jgi:hypothetical protein
MPLLDHFHPPMTPRHGWESFHSNWATRIADVLNDKWLPSEFLAEEYTKSGARLEIDVATFDEVSGLVPTRNGPSTATLAAPAYSAPHPARSVPVTFADTYEVRIKTTVGDARLVAAIELISPSNKDRPEERAAFAAKCASYLKEGVSVMIVDVVTTRKANLHAELLRLLAAPPGADLPAEAELYAVSYRPVSRAENTEIDLWPAACAVGEPLPTLPLHLVHDLFVPVNLEESYMEARRRRRL